MPGRSPAPFTPSPSPPQKHAASCEEVPSSRDTGVELSGSSRVGDVNASNSFSDSIASSSSTTGAEPNSSSVPVNSQSVVMDDFFDFSSFPESSNDSIALAFSALDEFAMLE